jgi:hypothetical protein
VDPGLRLAFAGMTLKVVRRSRDFQIATYPPRAGNATSSRFSALANADLMPAHSIGAAERE